jgi:hypothetical protein
VPLFYTLMGDPNYQGAVAITVQPPPNSADTLVYVYRKQPRPMNVENYDTGTVTCNGSTNTITGNGTAFTTAHVGSTIRLSADTTHAPTDGSGDYPAAFEGIITQRVSATSLKVDHIPRTALTRVKYSISDQVDIETPLMLNLFKRCAERKLASLRHMDDISRIDAAWIAELKMAMGTDSRNHGNVVQGGGEPIAIPVQVNW